MSLKRTGLKHLWCRDLKFLESGDNFALCYGPLYDGMELENPPISILTETELYSNSDRPVRRRRRRTERESNIEMMIRDLSELKVGDPVVHLDHGVGRYRGLTSMSTPDGEAEFCRLTTPKRPNFTSRSLSCI